MDLKEQRLSIIMGEIISHGQVEIKALSKKLKVSTMTIYRDVEDFTNAGFLRKETTSVGVFPNLTEVSNVSIHPDCFLVINL